MSSEERDLAQKGLGYTRVRFKIQRGDSVDNRGEASVELMRTTEQNTAHETRWEAEDQLEAAIKSLEKALGL